MKRLKHEGTSINLANLPNTDALVVIDRGQPCEEWVTIKGVDGGVYKHKNWLHELMFNLTGLLLMTPWPQPKWIRRPKLLGVSRNLKTRKRK